MNRPIPTSDAAPAIEISLCLGVGMLWGPICGPFDSAHPWDSCEYQYGCWCTGLVVIETDHLQEASDKTSHEMAEVTATSTHVSDLMVTHHGDDY